MKSILTVVIVLLAQVLHAQQPLPVSDSLPAMQDGLKAGYTITETSEKEVGGKGNFSRYKMKFYVTNTTGEAKILMQKPNVLFSGSASPHLATFKCSNATGARFTNKSADINMQPCNIQAGVEDKDCTTGKVVKNQRLVDIGYWIKPNETISVSCIMITPLNEKPNMAVIFYPYFSGIVATPVFAGNQPPTNVSQDFVKVKNFASNRYLHNQNGPLSCSEIEPGWWSAQWEILPVSGTNNFQIHNRWKNNFISTDNATMLSENGQSAKAMWMIEETSTNNTFFIKNVADNSKLVFENGLLKATNSYNNNDVAAKWIIEK